jgi:hypothetical protein
MHMHTLILRFLKYKKIKNYNSLSGFIINLFLIPNFIMSINFFNNTKILFITTLLYIFFYILIYIKIYNFLDNKKLFNFTIRTFIIKFIIYNFYNFYRFYI